MSVSGRHTGLPAGQSKSDLLQVLQDLGRKGLGLTPSAFDLLMFLCRRANRVDFLHGSICTSWMRVGRIAREIGISERSINNAQRELRTEGFIKITTSANGARWGERVDGQIRWASGLSLAPTIKRFAELTKTRDQKISETVAISELQAEIRRLRSNLLSSGLIPTFGARA
ncbi:helix-turn-helix domain-containing protein [Novosphingobium sp. BW1]|uniref:helix-turn-helix domain-containing protein n=1 Tax=Novosphingobium sp. BW1 TaxID=2592621 RepID=UPI0011DEE6A4|nr:helix-turn-helix domain-containing protein [Novosphingobium sp. BW1]TYC87018.1 MarR family transcriptional regulator [Novosphingobium sp. BW1]